MIATIILLGLLFIKLGIGLATSESCGECIGKFLGCVIMLVLYYYAGLFNNFG
jgi:hypothetical protein